MRKRSPLIVTFLSDFGTADGYAGSVKGVIKSKEPRAEIIDISHHIAPFDISAAAFALLNYYQQFPTGTVHLLVIDPGVGSSREPIILQTKNHYFIGPDNGVFRFVEEREAYRKYRILEKKYEKLPASATFHGRDIFAPAAAFLAGGGSIEKIAKALPVETDTDRVSQNLFQVYKDHLEIPAVAIDHFGNIITALSKESFARYVDRLRYIEIKKRKISGIQTYYAQQTVGGLMALWGSLNLLEIAVNQGNAAENLQFDLNRDKVYIYLSKTELE